MTEATATHEPILGALRRVKDPDLGRDIVSLGFVKDVKACGENVSFTIELTTPACPVREQMKEEARRAVLSVPGIKNVEIKMTSQVRATASEQKDKLVPRVKNIVPVASGKARGVFDGKIIVRPDAQKTSAIQTNKNLLLSKEALVNTKPELQIHANDVKCKHGATIGQLHEDALFYLRSRGIGREEARRLLVEAFAGEILDQLRIAPVRDELARHLFRGGEAA